MTAVKTPKPFVVMAKPVGPSCNMKCGYCYYTDGGRLSVSQPSKPMEDGLLERFIRQYIEASPGSAVSFTWHGGEPALAGIGFYETVVAIQQKHLPPGWTCWNSLQTNGLLLNDDWCAFLADAGFDVGLSIDGTQSVHDLHRKDSGGQDTYLRVAATAERLLKHGIHPDLMCTVTAQAAKQPLAVYRALREFSTGWLQFIPIVRLLPDGSLSPETVSGEAYGLFLRDIFDEWLLHDLGKTDVQLFAETMLVWMGGQANLCTMAPVCGRVLIVERDGGVYSCDHFVSPEHRIGDIRNAHLGALIDTDAQRRFGLRKKETLPPECLACKWLDVCNGGCPKDRIAKSGGEYPLNSLCAGMKLFYTHAEKPLKHIIALRKRGVPDGVIMREFQRIARDTWKNVGRNDPCPCQSGKKAKNCCWARYH